MQEQQRIDEVLASRAEAAEAVKRLELNATAVREAVRELDEQASLTAARGNAETAAAAARLRSAVIEAVNLLDTDISKCTRLRTRLARSTLSIGAVGRARGGKSRFLQSLTGLGRDVIPDSEGGFCTGVTSIIRPSHETSAVVIFRTPAEYLALLAPYYAELGLGSAPNSIGSISRPIPPAGDDNNETWRHLLGSIDALATHRHLLGSSPQTIAPSELRRWVTQEAEDGTPQHEHRFVSRVEISAPFAAAVSGISVVDLPGMGDTNLTDLPRILAAVEDEVDVVVILRRPDPVGDDWTAADFDLFARVRDALPRVPTTQRTFLLLNRMKAPNNDKQVAAFQQKLTNRSMAVASTLTADATDPGEVAAAFSVVLEHLIATTAAIDRSLVDSLLQQLSGTYDHVFAISALGQDITGTAADASPLASQRTVQLIKVIREKLAVALESYVEELRRARQDHDEPLLKAVEQVVQSARSNKGIRTPDEVDGLAAFRGGMPIAYLELLNQARAHLARHFVGLEKALDVSVDDMKSRFVAILSSEGGLHPLCDGRGSDWLIGVADELQLALGTTSTVRDGLAILASARLTYRGFLQHRVRPLLDGLNPNDPFMPMQPGIPHSAGVVRDMVEVTYDNALGRVELMLRDAFLAEPSQAVFALAEEFVDRILRSQGADEEWATIYIQYKNRIWPAEWESLTSDMADIQRWRTALTEFTEKLESAQREIRPSTYGRVGS